MVREVDILLKTKYMHFGSLHRVARDTGRDVIMCPKVFMFITCRVLLSSAKRRM